MKKVVFGILGCRLDAPRSQDKKGLYRWKPTVAVATHPDFLPDVFELIFHPGEKRLLDSTMNEILRIRPEIKIRPHCIPFLDPWDFEEVYLALQDFALKYEFHTDKEEYSFHITTGTHVQKICSFLLCESRHFPARLIQAGPDDSMGPVGRLNFIDLELSRYDNIARRFLEQAEVGVGLLKGGIETRNPAFNRMVEEIELVAVRSGDPILLQGPTGAGKGRMARRIYELRKSRHQLIGEFVSVNCATLRGDLAMSNLFGHVRGAYTGSLKDRPGLLKTADRGILFLDEIAELGLDEQAMLLKALEDGTFFPVGSDTEIHSDFQLIAGTNRDLAEDCQQGRFREDLLARLNLWSSGQS